jgi:hypothetical protein
MAKELLGTADPAKVKKLFDILNAALNAELANEHYAFVDVFLASHNLHKFVTLGLEKQTEDGHCVWRGIALATLNEALSVAPPFKAV